MPTFDLVLVVILGIFILYGFYLGLVRMVLSLISAILSIIISLNIYLYFSKFLSFIDFLPDAWVNIISFLLVLSVVNYLLNIVFRLIGKVLKLVSSLPVISFVNRIMGGVFGLVQGVFILGIIVYVSSRYVVSNIFLNSWMTNSELAPIFMGGINWISPLVPEALKMLQSVIV